MIKISMGALIRTLAVNNQTFVVKQSSTNDEVIWFAGSLVGDSNYGHYVLIGTPSELDNIGNDRRALKNAQVLLQYDMSKQAIIGCCSKWHDLIVDTKRKAKKTVIV